MPYANFDMDFILAHCRFVLLILNRRKTLHLKVYFKGVKPWLMTSID